MPAFRGCRTPAIGRAGLRRSSRAAEAIGALAMEPGAPPRRRRAARAPWVIKPAASPASTSPDPAVASVAGAWTLMTARPSGAAITVSGPLSRTVAPLERRRLPHARDLARHRRQVGKQAPELAFVRRQQDGPADRREQARRISAKAVMASASSTTRPAGRQRRQHGIARALVDAGARTDQEGVAPLVLQQSREGRAVIDFDDQVAGLGHPVDGRRRLRRRDGHQPCPGAPGRQCRQPRRAGGRSAAEDREMAARVFVVAADRRAARPPPTAAGSLRQSRGADRVEHRRSECRYRRPAARRTGAVLRANNGRAWRGRRSP